MHLPDWTWRHQQDHILCGTRSSWSDARSLCAWQLNLSTAQHIIVLLIIVPRGYIRLSIKLLCTWVHAQCNNSRRCLCSLLDRKCSAGASTAQPWRSLCACQLNRSNLWRLRSFQLLLGNSFGNFCAVYSLSRYKFFNHLYWTACLQTQQWCVKMSFLLPWKMQSKVSKHDVWCEIIMFKS